MALFVKRHDTWPHLRGRAEDENGAMPLASADSLAFRMTNGTTTISGVAHVIDPPDSDGNNWYYAWTSTDLNTAGTWKVELKVTWNAAASPPAVETVPSHGTATLTIEAEI